MGDVEDTREQSAGGWTELAAFLVALPEEDRDRVSYHLDLPLTDDPESIARVLSTYSVENPQVTSAALLATTGARIGASGNIDLARALGRAALDLAGDSADAQLAHVLLAQTHFKNRSNEADLRGFVEHCRAAIESGHEGTFCYERLAVLYEYRGEKKEAASICRRAIEVLEAAGDPRSAARFRKRLERLINE